MDDKKGARLDIGLVVKQLGGVMAVSRRFKVKHPAVSAWVKVNSLPTRHAETLALQWGIERDWLHDPWGDSARLTSWQMGRLLDGLDPFEEEKLLVDDDDLFDYNDPVNWEGENE